MSLRCLVLVLLFAPMVAWGAQSAGIRLYERGAYARAVRALKDEANNPRRSEQERALARVYLAASLMALEKADEARRQLEELARTYPEQRVDPALFPPELVELERLVRAGLETERLRKEAEEAERLAAEAERERLAAEAERRQREAEALQQTPLDPPQEVQDDVDSPEAPSTARLRLEAITFTDLRGFARPRPSMGAGVGITLGSGMVEGTLRVLGGNSPALELEGGLVFGRGAFQPRVGVRATGIGPLKKDPSTPESKETTVGGGLGAVVGARLALSPRFTAMVDVGLQGFRYQEVSPGTYRDWSVLASAGLGFDVL